MGKCNCRSPNTGGIVVDGKAVPGTLKIPANYYTAGEHQVALLEGAKRPLLMHTTLELVEVNGAVYTVNGYGHGTLRFTGVDGMKPTITDPSGQPIAFEQWPDETGTYLQVRAAGQPLVVAWK